jgi:short-subunit dehydrogenase involved in D-alanine esterification of teichoic acids
VRALRHAGATVVPVDMHGDDCLIANVATAEGNRQMVDLALERHDLLDILILNAGAQAMNPCLERPDESARVSAFVMIGRPTVR